MAAIPNPRVGYDPDPYIGEVWDDPSPPTTPIREEATPSSPVPMPAMDFHVWKELARKDRVRAGFFSPPPKGTWEYLQLQTDHKFPIPVIEITPVRFDDVECAKATAVSIEYEDGSSRPIHANRMGSRGLTDWKSLIASQYPYVHYWDAIYQQTGPCLIVDLTRKGEGEPLFYPNKWAAVQTDELKIRLIARNERISTYEIEPVDPSKSMAIVRRLHFSGWPDRGVVSLDQLYALVSEIEHLMPDKKNSGVWVHCHAGVGRTGTLLTALLIKEMILNGTMNPQNLNEEVIELILTLRQQRSEMIVSNKEQFLLLLDFARLVSDRFRFV